MNKTWSIILIVVASLVIVGGTFWYFGVQKTGKPETPSPSAIVEPTDAQPPLAEATEGPKPKVTTEQTLPVAVSKTPTAQPKSPVVTSPSAESETQAIQSDKASLGKPTLNRQIPAPIAPVMSKQGGFALPSLGNTGDDEDTNKEPLTSVLAKEELSPKADMITAPTKEESPKTERPEGQVEPSAINDVKIEKSQKDEATEASGIFAAKKEEASPVADEEVILEGKKVPVQTLPQVVTEEPAAKEVPPVVVAPPTMKTLTSTTVEAEEKMLEKPAIEANLSVSFLDYNIPYDFTSPEKSFNVSLDVMSQKEVFGWGGTLEVGRNTTADVVQISLLAKTSWKIGKGVVTYPLSLSIGPTLFIDSAANTPEFGLKAKFGAGVTYAISESFRMFYAVGIGATYNFQDSSSFRFALEPIRVGVGFSF